MQHIQINIPKIIDDEECENLGKVEDSHVEAEIQLHQFHDWGHNKIRKEAKDSSKTIGNHDGDGEDLSNNDKNIVHFRLHLQMRIEDVLS